MAHKEKRMREKATSTRWVAGDLMGTRTGLSCRPCARVVLNIPAPLQVYRSMSAAHPDAHNAGRVRMMPRPWGHSPSVIKMDRRRSSRARKHLPACIVPPPSWCHLQMRHLHVRVPHADDLACCDIACLLPCWKKRGNLRMLFPRQAQLLPVSLDGLGDLVCSDEGHPSLRHGSYAVANRGDAAPEFWVVLHCACARAQASKPTPAS